MSVDDFILAILLAFTSASSLVAGFVPGKFFDRWVTIWLENEVCPA